MRADGCARHSPGGGTGRGSGAEERQERARPRRSDAREGAAEGDRTVAHIGFSRKANRVLRVPARSRSVAARSQQTGLAASHGLCAASSERLTVGRTACGAQDLTVLLDDRAGPDAGRDDRLLGRHGGGCASRRMFVMIRLPCVTTYQHDVWSALGDRPEGPRRRIASSIAVCESLSATSANLR